MAYGENEVIHVKLALREGSIEDWAMYVAPGDWSDLETLENGHKLDEETATRLIRELLAMGFTKKP